MKPSKKAKITLVGAGPGDPELMTLAGVRALQSADVVLYDALVNPEVLAWAPDATHIFVGKRKGYKRYPQSDINYLLVANALENGHVVRLKGGDSFIFGRGAEELDYIHSFGIETAVIPGISSATSAGTTQQIPLTKRGVSDGFWVITGTKSDGSLSTDIALAAQSKATVVILMGMAKLGEITACFQKVGKGDAAIAIVQNAYRDHQQSVVGTIDDIEAKVAARQLKNPAVIIIGEVVKQSEHTRHVFWQDEAWVALQQQYCKLT